VAERHEISTGLLSTWRRQFMAEASAGFMPVQLATSEREPPPCAPCPTVPGQIEIDMPNGVRVRAGHGADLKVLGAVLAALGRG
jgi:transposase-like protein